VPDTDATLARLQAICLSLPDTKVSTSWGKPHFTVGGKVFAAFDEIEGEPTLSIQLAGDDADQRVSADARLRPSRYRGGAEVLVNRIDDWDEARAFVIDSYRLIASRTSVAKLDSGESTQSVQATTAPEVKPRRAARARAPRTVKTR